MAIIMEKSHQTKWQSFLREHIDMAYAVAYRFSGNEAEAQKLIEKVLANIWGNPDELMMARRPKAKLLTYIRKAYIEHRKVENANISLLPSSQNNMF